MKLRRLRNTNMGESNRDFRSKIKHPKFKKGKTTTHLNFLKTHKNYTFRCKQAYKKENSNLPIPRGTTRDFYKRISKDNKERVNFEFIRYGQLQERKKGKPWFTGDGNLIYDRRPGLKSTGKTEKPQTPQKYVAPYLKWDMNSMAAQETQLVAMDKYKFDTLEGKIDLDKVREIRRLIRRRYANRKHIKKIFKLWDLENKGYISIKNVMDMTNKMGLKVNQDEARVLIASSDQNRDNVMKLDEFIDMIYNTEDALNVNLKKIARLQKGEKPMIKKEGLDRYLINDLTEDAAFAKKARHENQLRLIIQNRLPELNNKFFKHDYTKHGNVTSEQFKCILKGLGINERLLTDKDIQEMFDKHKISDSAVDYKSFMFDIRSYKLHPEKLYVNFLYFLINLLRNQIKMEMHPGRKCLKIGMNIKFKKLLNGLILLKMEKQLFQMFQNNLIIA